MTHTPVSRRFILAVGAAALLVPQIGLADVLEHFTFGTQPPSLLSPTSLSPGINASPITKGAGVNLDVNSDQGNPPASSPWLRINPIAANVDPAAAVAADARFLFTLAPLPGFTMGLTSLDFNVIKGGNSTRGYAVQTTAGQLGAGPWTAAVPTYRGQTVNGVLSPWTPVSIPLTDPAYQGLSSITFSIYSYSPGGGASVEYDDLIVNGELTFAGYTWTGVTGAWDTTAPNWTGPGAVYADATPSSHVLFTDDATVTNVAVAAGGLAPANFYISNDSKAYTFSGGAVNTPGILHKSGAANVTISNNVTAGSAVAAVGTMIVGNGGTLTSASTTVEGGATLTVTEGGALGATTGLTLNGTVVLEDNQVTISTLNGVASGALQLDPLEFEEGAAGILEVTGGGTFAGKISGFGSLVKSGTDVLVLSGVNEFVGGIEINGGAVQLSNASAGGLNGATVNENGTLLLGSAVTSGITLAGGTLGVTAAVTVPAATTVNVMEDSTIATYNTVTNANRFDLIFLGELKGTGDITLSAINGDNPDGGAAFRLRGPSSDYSGTITVPKAAKFEVRSADEVGSPMGTGTLVMQGGSFFPLPAGGTGLLGDYSLINVRNASTTGNIKFGNNVVIEGPGMAVFNMVTDTGAIPGSESTFGKLTIGDGQSIAAVATGTNGMALGFDTVTLTGGNTTFIPRPVGNTSFTATHNIRLGVISQGATPAGITVDGVGAVILSAANTYTGPTIVQAGSLIVDGSIAGSETAVNGGILGGNGTVGEVTLAGGAIDPGNGIGALDTGNLILDSGTLAFQLGGNTSELYDQINVTGTVSLNAQVNLTLDFAAYDPVDFTDKFVLVNNNLADAIAFGSSTARLWYGGVQLDEGTTFVATSGAITQGFSISYTGGDGNDVVLSAVPEPATAVTLLGGVALLAGMRRRRRN